MNPDPSTPERQRRPDAFVTTQWTLVLAAQGKTSESQEALRDLCDAYYQPVVKFLRCGRYTEDAARELAHEFFARLLQKGGLGGFRHGRARFRSYLLGAVKHFVADAQDREQAAKRGRDYHHVPLDEGAVTSAGIDPSDDRPTPEQEFDRHWALTVLARALEALTAENQDGECREHFEALKPWLTGDVEGLSQADVANRLGMTEGAVKVAIHRLRKRFRDFVKQEVARTLSEPALVEEELQALIDALRVRR